MDRHRQVVLFWLASAPAFVRVVNLPERVWTQMLKCSVWRQPTPRAELRVSLSPILSELACWPQELASLQERLALHPVDPQPVVHHSEDTAE
jgi:hypothetical protein